MKKIILLFALLLSFITQAQDPWITPEGGTNEVRKDEGGRIMDSLFVMPVRGREALYPDVPMLGRQQMNKNDSIPEFYNGESWQKLLTEEWIYVVSSIEELKNYTGNSGAIIVKDKDRGGVFYYDYNMSVFNDGVSFEAVGRGSGGYIRDLNQAKGWNVKWWGAVGDGITDDLNAIQAAGNSIPEEGGSLYFPAGIYYSSSTINIPNPTFLIGDSGFAYQFGMGGIPPFWGSIITTDNATDDLFFFQKSCSFSDISFRNTSATEPTSGIGLNLNHAGSFSMHNVSILGFYDNLKINKGTRWNISSFNSWFPKHYGIHIINPNDVIGWTDTGDTSITGGSVITNKNGVTGIKYESSGGLKITNFKINPLQTTRTGIGIDVDIIPVGTSILLLNNVSIEGYSGNGLKVRRQIGATFGKIIVTGCQMFPAYTGAGSCVDIANATGVTIVGNDFSDDGTNTGVSAVLLTSVSNGNVYPNTYSGWSSKVSLVTCTNVVGEPDFIPTNGSLNLVSSTGVFNAIANADALTVHKAGTETITGSKTTSGNWTNLGVWNFDSPNFITLKRTTVATTGIQGALVINLESSGTPVDGFGPRMPFQIQGNQIGGLAAVRDGANNSGKLVFQTYNSGVLGEYVTIDKTGKAVFSGTIEVPNQTLGDNDTSAANTAFVQQEFAAKILSGSATLDFPDTASGSSNELTLTVTGVTDGDVVSLGIVNSVTAADSCYTARVSGTNTVTIKYNNYGMMNRDPVSAVFKVKVFK